MAKVKGPLFSVTARGSFGPRLTFSKRSSGQQVRSQRAQKDYESTPRKTQRDKFTSGIAYWGTLTDEEKSQYNTDTWGLNITGFNFFMKKWLLGLITPAYQLLLETGFQLLQEDGYRINLQ